MSSTRPARITVHRARPGGGRVAALLVLAAVVALVGDRVPASSTSTAPSPAGVPTEERGRPASARRPDQPPGALGEAHGAVPDRTSVFDDGVAGVANLDPALLGALRRAAADAADDGIELVVDSGWRSPQYQQQLLDAAVSQHGSREEAARWVATPDTSAHVPGDAVDIGPTAAARWLSRHGAAYGLCQTYGNEPWHYELRPDAGDRGCPPLYADPTHDPRMRR